MKKNKQTDQTINTNAAVPVQSGPRAYVNFKLRDQNRMLAPEAVCDLLRQHAPELFDLAEIVGEWVWITFETEPAEKVRAQLSQFGFHWNNARKCWQHPCGKITERATVDPRQKYGTRFAADLQPA